jgi:hypothetical protein
MKATLLLMASLLLALSAPAATFHVAPGGSDAAAGSVAAPWATLQHAVDIVAPGDVVVVHAGTYAGCRIERSGAPGAPCTLMAEVPGAAIIDAAGPRNRHQSNLEVELFGTTLTDWIIDGFEVSGSLRYGIDMRDVNRITVRRCNVHGSAVTGIFDGFVDHPTYEDNESWNNGEHGIYHSNSGDDAIIRGNRLHHNAGCGLHMNGDASQGGDGIISRVLVERNVIWENGLAGGSGINGDGVTDSVIRNNLLYDNHASGIALFGIDGAVGSSRNLVANNTIVQAADNRSRWVINMSAFGGAFPPVDNRILNNILYTPRATRGSVDIWDPAAQGFESDYNVVVDLFSPDSESSTLTLAQWQALGHDTHSIIATPAQLFVDAAAGDYTLRPGSPAIDAGTVVPEVVEDLWGDPRPQGAGWDIGADEVVGCAPPGLVTALSMAPDRRTMTWTATADADAYDVVRGDLIALHASGGDFGAALQACVEDDGPDLTADDPTVPGPGGALFWLVRAVGCGAPSSWDSGGALQLRSRDASIAGSQMTCP